MIEFNKFKIFLGLIYVVLLFIFLYIFFSKFTYQEITSYKFIQDNHNYLLDIKQNSIIFISTIFIFITIFWVILLGFGSPIALVGGFIYGKWLGTLFVVSSLTLGSTILYLIGKFFFLNFLKKIFLSKFEHLEVKFKKQELVIMIIFRLAAVVPFPIANLLPILFDVKLKNYFIGTFIGLIPSLFILVSLGSGLEKIISNNEKVPSFVDLLLSPEIYIPLIGFFALLILSIVIKNIFKLNIK